MNALDNQNHLKAQGYSLQGGLLLFITVILSAVNISVFGFTLSFMMMPLAVIYLWPAGATITLSYNLVFIGGLILDFLTNGPLGLWAMTFLISMYILRPDTREQDFDFPGLWTGFAIWAAVVLGVLSMLDQTLLDIDMTLSSITGQFTVAVLVFPFLYAVIYGVQILLMDPDDRPVS